MRHRFAKSLNLLRALGANALRCTAPFVRLLPTDRCNLDCAYCFQKSRDPREMTRDEFDAYLHKARQLRVALISFLGGEPLLWPHLQHAIQRCTDHRVFSDVTTNGTLLDAERMDALGRAGLDFLNVSVDVTTPGRVTAKNFALRPGRLEQLTGMRRRHGTQVRINSVVFKDNTAQIKELVELAHAHTVPISIGFVVPEFGRHGDGDAGI